MRMLGLAAILTPFVVSLAGCVSGDDSSTPTPFQAKFQPSVAIMPFPNDLYFNGSTTGQLNIPSTSTSAAAVAATAPLLALNHLDGFGTQSDINIFFNAPVDSTTLAANIFVYKVSSTATTKAINPPAPAGSGSAPTLLKAGTDYSIALSAGTDSGNAEVTIKPLHPLAASTVTSGVPVPATYLVVVTNGVKSASGGAVTPSSDYASILKADLPVLSGGKMGTTGNTLLDQVALFTLPQLIDAAAAKIDPTTVALTFSFSTQYEGLSLAQVAATATATTQATGTGIFDTTQTVCAILVASKQVASAAACPPGSTNTELYAGDVTLPYYLSVPAKGSNVALTDSWHNAAGGDIAISATNPTSLMPKATGTVNIPILIAIPLAAAGCATGSPWKTVIFQHGITRNREDMLGIASTLAVGASTSLGGPGLCNAVVAIDLPLHGVTNASDPFYKNQIFTGTPAAAALTAPVTERTFDMDATGAAGAASASIAGSGSFFINLNSTITSRDNLREGAADLINLVASLPNIHAVGTSVNSFDSTNVFYVGHSLGGIVGTVFLGADTEGAALTASAPKIKVASLASPGGHVAELLRNSPSFEPVIDTQLAANGIAKGSQFYYDFYSNAQAMVEDGDPGNYAALAAAGHPLHMMEVIGGLNGAGDTCNLPDQVVPNSATDLLVTLMGLQQVNTTTPGGKFVVRFLAGDHGSVLSPIPPTVCPASAAPIYGAVTVEMQTEILKFILASGAAVTINNSAGIIK